MKAYKGFNKNLKCRDFQYEVGNTYEQEGGVEICEKGFHAIDGNESPLNVFDYYPPSSNGERNRYCEVELEGNVKKDCEKIA